MSDAPRILLLGATGLIGRKVIEACLDREDVRLIALARREFSLPKGAKMELVISDPRNWNEVIAALAPDALICALGTTWKRAGSDEADFRAVDQQLVLDCARAAQRASTRQMVFVSSIGAAEHAGSLYLRVKGGVERELSFAGFARLDVLRPGLLRGARINDRRLGEGIAQVLAPLIDPFLFGKWRAYRSIRAELVAQAALGLALRRAPGRFTHDHEGILRAAREWAKAKARP